MEKYYYIVDDKTNQIVGHNSHGVLWLSMHRRGGLEYRYTLQQALNIIKNYKKRNWTQSVYRNGNLMRMALRPEKI